MSSSDPSDLDRFVQAQAPTFEGALGELKAGRKRTHWMWFIFPQMRGLGVTPTATFYGITSLEEAHAYLDHSVLGPRLVACTAAVLEIEGRSLNDILGSPDDLKFRSSVTLFDVASQRAGNVFRTAIDRWCGGTPDQRTLDLLGQARTAR